MKLTPALADVIRSLPCPILTVPDEHELIVIFATIPASTVTILSRRPLRNVIEKLSDKLVLKIRHGVDCFVERANHV
jgi:hypothetical protein